MALTLTFLRVDQVVIHELPPREGGKKKLEPVLSEIIQDPGEDAREFFKNRTVNSLSTAGRSIRFMSKTSSTVPKLVREYLDGDGSDLLPMSQACARHLATCQEPSEIISSGLICVAGCTYKSARALALVKLESQEGVRLTRDNPKGKLRRERPTAQRTELLPVRVTGQLMSSGIEIRVGDVSVSVREGTDAEYVAELVRALRSC